MNKLNELEKRIKVIEDKFDILRSVGNDGLNHSLAYYEGEKHMRYIFLCVQDGKMYRTNTKPQYVLVSQKTGQEIYKFFYEGEMQNAIERWPGLFEKTTGLMLIVSGDIKDNEIIVR